MSSLKKARLHSINVDGSIGEDVDVLTSGDSVTLNNGKTLEDVYQNEIGDTSKLNTTNKDLVNAVNENTYNIKANADNIKSISADLSDYTKVNSYLPDTGVANAYVITPNPAITSYVAGQVFKFKAVNANTGASTVSVNGLATKSLVKDVDVALVAGDILAGQIITAMFDGTNFQIVPNLKTQLALKAPLASPTFTGGVTVTGTLVTDFSQVLEIGSFIDFHNSGSANDFDYRMHQTGGRIAGCPYGGSESVILEKRDIVNNLTATVAGSPLDATQGTLLNNRISNRNDFSYGSINGQDLNNYKGYELHIFTINSVNGPISSGHGFLDVQFFRGDEFAISVSGITLQKYHKYDTGQQYTRTYNHTTGVWSAWIIG